jgi:hypothetical protein
MLNDLLRQELKEILANDRMDGLFGDGMEMEYIMGGCTIVGLNEMSDEELVNEYAENADEDEDDGFLAKLRAEIESHKMLKIV